MAPRALPFADVETVTNAQSAFTLALDTGGWRLDFSPGEDLPRYSRLVTVVAANLSDASVATAPTQSLDDIILSNGRRVSGLVTNAGGAQVEILPNASVRFFRVLELADKRQSILLDATIADSRGRYTVMLPARQHARQPHDQRRARQMLCSHFLNQRVEILAGNGSAPDSTTAVTTSLPGRTPHA